MSETRKLAAILVADIVGYSRLAGADEDRTLARLRGLRSDLIDPAIAAHHGRIVKRTGDGTHHRVPQRRRRGALRDRGAERHDRAQRRRAARTAHRVSRRHSSRRHCRGERRRPDGRRRQHRRAAGGHRQAGRDLSFRGRLSSGQGAARDRRSAISAQPSSRTLPSRSGSIRFEVGQPAQAKPAPTAIAAVRAESAAPSPNARVSCAGRRLPPRSSLAVFAAAAYAWHSGFAPRLLSASVAEDKLATAPRLSIVVLPFENLSGDPGAGLFRRRHHRRPDDRPLASARQFRHRPRHGLHLQGQAGRREADRPRARRALCARRQRAPGRRDDHRQRAAHLDRDRRACLGRPVRRRARQARPIAGGVRRSSRQFARRRARQGRELCARCASGRTIRTRSIFPCVAGRSGIETRPPRQTKTPPLVSSSARSPSTPSLSRRWSVLRSALVDRVDFVHSENPTSDIARAGIGVIAPSAAEPDNSAAHMAKAWVFLRQAAMAAGDRRGRGRDR